MKPVDPSKNAGDRHPAREFAAAAMIESLFAGTALVYGSTNSVFLALATLAAILIGMRYLVHPPG
jgi:hypothetical protein